MVYVVCLHGGNRMSKSFMESNLHELFKGGLIRGFACEREGLFGLGYRVQCLWWFRCVWIIIVNCLNCGLNNWLILFVVYYMECVRIVQILIYRSGVRIVHIFIYRSKRMKQWRHQELERSTPIPYPTRLRSAKRPPLSIIKTTPKSQAYANSDNGNASDLRDLRSLYLAAEHDGRGIHGRKGR